jgi:hypothetical protein
MSNDALIARLSANLDPVSRRSALCEGALLLALGSIELALFVGVGLMRPDMGRMIGSSYMLWKLGSLALLVAISWVTAVNSFSPTASPRPGLATILAMAAVAMIVGVFVDPGLEAGTLLDRLSPSRGILCSLSIVVLSLPMAGVMGMLMRRGAPSQPEGSALAAGLAAGTWGAFVFAFCCPINDPLYVIVWYCVGCAGVAAAARWLLPRSFTL